MNLNCITLSVLTTNQNLDMQIYIWFKKKKLSEDSKNTLKIEFYGNYFMVQALQD